MKTFTLFILTFLPFSTFCVEVCGQVKQPSPLSNWVVTSIIQKDGIPSEIYIVLPESDDPSLIKGKLVIEFKNLNQGLKGKGQEVIDSKTKEKYSVFEGTILFKCLSGKLVELNSELLGSEFDGNKGAIGVLMHGKVYQPKLGSVENVIIDFWGGGEESGTWSGKLKVDGTKNIWLIVQTFKI
tara:strand:+ start:450 stop:998 length:549 start_codon:yes stop_codon:yes gene_type:complete